MSSQLQTTSSTASIGRVTLVLTLAIWMLSVALPSVIRLWSPLGSYGYLTNADGVITTVGRGSPADVAGIHVGDRIVLRSVPYSVRRYAIGPLTLAPAPGTKLELFLQT